MSSKTTMKDGLVINLAYLRFCGTWPGDTKDHRARTLYNLYGCLVVSSMTMMYFLAEAIHVSLIWTDFHNLIEVSYVSLTHVGQFVKMMNFLARRGRIEKLVEATRQAKFLPREEYHEFLCASTIHNLNICHYFYLFMVTSTCIGWSIIPLIDDNQARRLPVKAWFPFDTSRSPVYELIYAYLSVSVTMNACLNAMLDTTVVALITVASVQVDMLRHDLEDFGGNGERNDATTSPRRSSNNGSWLAQLDSSKADETSMTSRNNVNGDGKGTPRVTSRHILRGSIADRVEHHKAIVEFAREIQETFGIGILTQFAVSSIIICLACFELSLMSPWSLQFYSTLLYQSCMIVELFCYCWCGDRLLIKTSELTRAAFASDWISSSPENKASLRIFMCRMQRPIRLVVGELFAVSLDTFTHIMRSAYSLYAVLEQMHSPEYRADSSHEDDS